MPVDFRAAAAPGLHPITIAAPAGSVIGVIGFKGSGKVALLRLAAGVDQPLAGSVSASEPRRFLSSSDPLDLDNAATLALHHSLATKDAVARSRAAIALEQARRRGATVLLTSHEPDLLRWLCDEIWWLDQGRLAAKGDPAETLERYQRHVAQTLRQGAPGTLALTPTMRKGDGRATLLNLETLDENGKPVSVWHSGAQAGVRAQVRFAHPVADPVIGILIRTRIGFEVFGTNTELEKVKLGPCAAGDAISVEFRFPCNLCPQEYTITAASHDPDGVWHDWMEDGVAFSVVDSRYTAGVANLRASVVVTRD